MMTEPTLFDQPLLPRKKSNRERFEDFHASNPHVYEEMVKRVRALKGRGVTHYSVAPLLEVIRYFIHLEQEDPSTEFRINDHYRPWYARLIMIQEPDLDGFFELRTAEADIILKEHEEEKAENHLPRD